MQRSMRTPAGRPVEPSRWSARSSRPGPRRPGDGQVVGRPEHAQPPPPDSSTRRASGRRPHPVQPRVQRPGHRRRAIGIVCGSTELLFRSSGQSSASGSTTPPQPDPAALPRVLRRELHQSRHGKVATWTQHDTVKHDLAVPGDATSGTTHISGLLTRVTGPNGHTILTDAGMFFVVEATGETLRAAPTTRSTTTSPTATRRRSRRCATRSTDPRRRSTPGPDPPGPASTRSAAPHASQRAN